MEFVKAQICSETRNVGSIFVRRISPQCTDSTNGRSKDGAVDIYAISYLGKILLMQDFYNANIYFLFLFDYGISQ